MTLFIGVKLSKPDFVRLLVKHDPIYKQSLLEALNDDQALLDKILEDFEWPVGEMEFNDLMAEVEYLTLVTALGLYCRFDANDDSFILGDDSNVSNMSVSRLNLLVTNVGDRLIRLGIIAEPRVYA